MSATWTRRFGAIKSRAVRMAGPIGLYALAKGLTRTAPRILMYHRFGTTGVPGPVFREQLRILKRQFRVVTLADLTRRMNEGALESDLAVVTIDDGYEDFYRVAFPILESEGVPATFFVTTGFVDRKIWLWPDILEYVLEHSDIRRPDLTSVGLEQTPELGTDTGRMEAWQQLVDRLLDLTSAARSERLATIASRLDVRLPVSPDRQHAPVSWDDLRHMQQAGIEIGAHTITHPRLTRLTDDALVEEIAGSKRRIEQEIGTPVTSFCYPNGAPEDYDDRVAEAVRHAGFDCAVVAHFDGRLGDRYSLRRLGVGKNMFQYRKSLAGIEHIGRKLLGSRAAVA